MARERGNAEGSQPERGGPSCEGTLVTYGRNRDRAREAHPAGVYVWGDCIRCNRSLGCSVCTTTNELEVLCECCAAWGTKAAFLHHGPIDNKKLNRRTGIERYPEGWRREYEQPAVGTARVVDITETTKQIAHEKALPRDKRIEGEDAWI